MKNKILLVFILCLLFSVPCYAEEISCNDVSYNEIISDSRNDSVSGSDIIGLPLLTTTNYETETIDYTELLEPISMYFNYYLSESSTEYYPQYPCYLSSEHDSIIIDGETAPFFEVFRILGLPDFDTYVFGENSSFYYFTCNFDDNLYPNAYIYFDKDTRLCRSATLYNYNPVFNSAPTSDMIVDVENYLIDLQKSTDNFMYLFLFLVLERVLYIAWDMFPRKDK